MLTCTLCQAELKYNRKVTTKLEKQMEQSPPELKHKRAQDMDTESHL